MKTPRLLKPDEISCRVQQVTDSAGAIILLYKDARVDMNILDETYGPTNWQRNHQTIDGNLYCTISIWDEDKAQWVSKQDVGVESATEATKGEASDAFKRAGFNWGIGRELYTAPFIFINLNADEWYTDKGRTKVKPSFRLTVKEIGYNDQREINRLILTDRKGAVRYTMGQKTPEPVVEKKPVKEATKVSVKQTDAEMKRRGDEIKQLFEEFGYTAADYKVVAIELKSVNPREMTGPEFSEHMKKVRQYLVDMKQS